MTSADSKEKREGGVPGLGKGSVLRATAQEELSSFVEGMTSPR